MNKLLATALTAALALANPAWADNAHHPEKAQEAAPAKPAVTAPAAKADPALQKMEANVKVMKAQLDRIAAAKTDAERRQAIADHMKTMQDNMRLAQGMAGGMMGCPMMDGGMMMGGGAAGDMAERMQQMEKRMDMMQMMLERTAPRPEGSAPAPTK